MFELLGKKYYKVFKAGDYPQGKVTAEELKRVAFLYSKDIYEAPLWMGHPNYRLPIDEPKAFGWVEDLMVQDDWLYASFSSVHPELMRMTSEKEFKKCSVELGTINTGDLKGELYLFAIGMTNAPAVPGMPDMDFAEMGHNFKAEAFDGQRMCFEAERDINGLFQNHNQTSMKSIIAFCNKHGFNLAETATEAEIATALESLGAKFKAAEDKVKDLEDKSGTTEAEMIFTQAVTEGRVLPAQKDALVSLYKGRPDDFKDFLKNFPEKTFTSKTVENGGVTGKDKADGDKLKKEDGTPLTYKDVLGNPKKYAKDLSEEDITALRTEDERFETAK